jgi:hypothetical protein
VDDEEQQDDSGGDEELAAGPQGAAAQRTASTAAVLHDGDPHAPHHKGRLLNSPDPWLLNSPDPWLLNSPDPWLLFLATCPRLTRDLPATCPRRRLFEPPHTFVHGF